MNLANQKAHSLVWSFAAGVLSMAPGTGHAATVRMSFPDVGPSIAVVGVDRIRQSAVDDYDLIVAPHSDTKRIRISFSGASGVRVDDRSGDLLIETTDHTQIRHIRAQISQQSAGHIVAIEGRYRLLNDETVGISVARYNRSLPLMINPTLVFTTFTTEFEAR